MSGNSREGFEIMTGEVQALNIIPITIIFYLSFATSPVIGQEYKSWLYWLKTTSDVRKAIKAPEASAAVANGAGAYVVGLMNRENPTPDQQREAVRGGIDAVANLPNSFGPFAKSVGFTAGAALVAQVASDGAPVMAQWGAGSGSIAEMVKMTANSNSVNVKGLMELELKSIQVGAHAADQYNQSLSGFITSPSWDKAGSYANRLWAPVDDLLDRAGRSIGSAVVAAAERLAPELVAPDQPLPVNIGSGDPGWKLIKSEFTGSSPMIDSTCFAMPLSEWQRALIGEYFDEYSSVTKCQMGPIGETAGVTSYSYQCVGNPYTMVVEGKLARSGSGWEMERILHHFRLKVAGEVLFGTDLYGRCELGQEGFETLAGRH